MLREAENKVSTAPNLLEQYILYLLLFRKIYTD